MANSAPQHRLSLVIVAVALCVALAAPAARALPNDIALTGLVDTSGSSPRAKNAEFRQLSRELGLVLVPASLQPAETTGQAGFDFGLDYSFHTMRFNESYWQDVREDPSVPLLMTLGARVRKGFVLPLPLTSEIELGAFWLINSQLMDLSGNLRVALNEGFRWIPDIAVEAGINRMVGHPDMDLFSATGGAQVSKGFGIAGSFNLCPYVAYKSIWVNASSRIVDTNPVDTANVDDNVVFDIVEAANNRMDRISFGLRFTYAVVTITGGMDVDFVPRIDAQTTTDPLLHYALRAGVSF